MWCIVSWNPLLECNLIFVLRIICVIKANTCLVCAAAAHEESDRGRLWFQAGARAARRGRSRITVEKRVASFSGSMVGGYLKLEAAFSLTALCTRC